ncbi:hypothetical protein Bca4012_032697 [Brassica carinata]|uniref:Uncharacterized protein n=1 Tax=Brassica carinata TaxID=52824 RepID=A0A8X7UR34_BRACI|nr:hypothetical protein Bca52824_046390 [Brassica carinata]
MSIEAIDPFFIKPLVCSSAEFGLFHHVVMSRLGAYLFFVTRLIRVTTLEIDHYLLLEFLLFGPLRATL